MYIRVTLFISLFTIIPVLAMNQKTVKAAPEGRISPAISPAAKLAEKKMAVAAAQEQENVDGEDFEPVVAEAPALAAGVSREQEAVTQVIAENAQKLRNPMSIARRIATKCSDTFLGTGQTVLAELRAKKLQHSNNPGSEGRRIERAAVYLASIDDYNGMRELLRMAKEQGYPITSLAEKTAKDLFVKQRHAVVAYTYQQLLVGIRDMGLVHDGEKIAGMKSKKLTPKEVLRGLCDEIVALFEAEQKKALAEAAETNKD